MENERVLFRQCGDQQLVSVETKKSKLLLMSFCTLLLVMCSFPDAQVKSILGIIQLTDSNGLTVRTLIWPMLVAVLYQAILYSALFNNTLKTHSNWKLKTNDSDLFESFQKTTAKIDENIWELNSLAGKLSSSGSCHSLEKMINEFIESVNDRLDLHIEPLIKKHNQLSEHIKDQLPYFERTNIDRASVLNHIDELKQVLKMNHRRHYEYGEGLRIDIPEYKSKLQQAKNELVAHIFYEKQRYHNIITRNLAQLEKQREQIIKRHIELSEIEWLDRLIYGWAPFSYVLIVLVYAIWVLS
ncbi:hypothetical protein LZP69_08590 [Shewanella sp. AS1]|uniref:hypothetical protein n=1 Tax=Shewanella sp. AS1 TaxID=2907626 RepID=UPI001F2528C2|nr:hypothetical protein [Shewanella sp. AS1]MCE9679230.1 hypothetical protein [Shewanella sp. AS1]